MPAPMELLRRVLLLCGLLVGGYLIIWPGGPLLVVTLEDLRADFENQLVVSKEELADPQAFAHFVEYRTEGRTTEVSGPEWSSLAQRLAAYDDTSDAELGARFQDYGTSESFVFRPDEQPFASVYESPAGWPEFQYLHLTAPGQQPREMHGPNPDESNPDQAAPEISAPFSGVWLTASLEPRQDIGGLPEAYAHPGRTWGLLLMAASVLAYVLLPRHKFGPHDLRYARFASVYGPDILGSVFAVLFGLLPFLIVWENGAEGAGVFSGGWSILTAVMWLLASLGVLMNFLAARYAGLAWRIDPDGLTKILGNKETLHRWDAMAKVEPYQTTIGRKLGFLLALTGRPGAMGQGILVAGNEAYGARITMRDGKTVKVMANHLKGFGGIMKALQERKVEGAE